MKEKLSEREETILEAFSHDDVKQVKKWLDEGTLSVDMRISGVPLIALTCTYKDKPKFRIAELLLQYGCNIEQKTQSGGSSPLFYAIQMDKPLIALMLLARGALPNETNKWGETPLARACAQRETKFDEIIQHLLANPKIKVSTDSVHDPLIRSIALRNRERVNLLVSHETANLERKFDLRIFIPDQEGKLPMVMEFSGDKPNAAGKLYTFKNKTAAEIARVLGFAEIADDLNNKMKLKSSVSGSPRSDTSALSGQSLFSVRSVRNELNTPLLGKQRPPMGSESP